MLDMDDATLMRALRAADPVDPDTLAAGARRRLERDWRDAGPDAARDPLHVPVRRRRSLQLVALAVAAAVVAGGAGTLSTVLGRRGDSVAADRAEGVDARAVEGSFRATVEDGSGRYRIDVADGAVHLRFERPRRYGAPPEWRGAADLEPVLADALLAAGGETFLHARTPSQERAGWYRYTGAEAAWYPWLGAAEAPVFAEGTRGFTRVDDEQAAGRDLTRYTADVATADLDFLGPFDPPVRDQYRRGEAAIDVWVDRGGRVVRAEETPRAAPEQVAVTRFERFDALAPIAVPAVGEVPVARDAHGIVLEAAGDPALADALRERVTAALDGDEEVAAYEFLGTPASGPSASESPSRGEGTLFTAVVQLVDGASGQRQMDDLSGLAVGTEDDGAVVEGYAYLSGVSFATWLELDG